MERSYKSDFVFEGRPKTQRLVEYGFLLMSPGRFKSKGKDEKLKGHLSVGLTDFHARCKGPD